jgi:hypothetical protein
MPAISAALAVKEGIGSPVLLRWLSVRDVEKPTAPATSASRVNSAMATTSASVAGSPLAPRSPMT